MRIIAGKFRRRQLFAPKDASTTRPMPDRVKESLFSILRGHTEGATVLDCFAGTGAVGLEALSRGAERVVFVEKDRRAADLLEKNIEALGAADECEVVRSDALGPAALARCPRPAKLIFMDPPYPLVLDPDGWTRVARQMSRLIENLAEDGYAILRTPWPFRHVKVIDESGNIVPHADPKNPFDVMGRLRKDLPPPSGKKFKGKHGRVYDDDDPRGNKAWFGDEIDVDEIQRETEEDIEAYEEAMDRDPTGRYRVEREDVDLVLPGSVGPETHVYASQAVHLYMRRT